MDIDSEEQTSERDELHLLAAIIDELMKALCVAGIMTRAQLQDIENAVASRTGTAPRTW